MAAPARKVVPLRKPAAKKTTKPRVRKPAAKSQTHNLHDATIAHKDKHTGFAVGLSEKHYWFLTATATALGLSRTALMNGVLDKMVGAAALRTKRVARPGRRA